ncbi:TRAP transporter large permease subunit [Alcaligenaceae bacterium CGII-47]|nr:TRAP transporter large permease subunit [Alcaligenaceae bacterium CGII-47]
MEEFYITLVALAVGLVLIGLRVPVGLALGTISVVGIGVLASWSTAFDLFSSTAYDVIANWELSAIPMFLLMGELAFNTGLTKDLFRAARLWVSWLPGGLAVATNFACAGFAAASGSSLATTITMGRIALPEMQRYGYKDSLACGSVASAGTLGSLIPPSIQMIIIGIFAQISILKLFIAAIIPGILTAIVFAGLIVIRCIINPSLAPRDDVKATWAERFRSLSGIWPLPFLVLGVIGSLYAGIVTPTQAGAIGATLTLSLALLRGQASLTGLRNALQNTLTSTISIFLIVIGAVLLSRLFIFGNVPDVLLELVSQHIQSKYVVMLIAICVYLVLGMFLDPVGIVLLTLPIFIPIFDSLGFNLVFIGIIIVKLTEIGLLSPPVGMNVFAVKTLRPEVPLGVIFKGAAWFMVADLLIIAALIAFPSIVLFLPEFMGL